MVILNLLESLKISGGTKTSPKNPCDINIPALDGLAYSGKLNRDAAQFWINQYCETMAMREEILKRKHRENKYF